MNDEDRHDYIAFASTGVGFGALGAFLNQIFTWNTVNGFDFLMLAFAITCLYFGAKGLFYGR